MKFNLTMKDGDKVVNTEELVMPNRDVDGFDKFFTDFCSNLPSSEAAAFFTKAIDLDVKASLEDTIKFYGERMEDYIADGKAGQVYTIIVRDRLVNVVFKTPDGKAVDHKLDANHPLAGNSYSMHITRTE